MLRHVPKAGRPTSLRETAERRAQFALPERTSNRRCYPNERIPKVTDLAPSHGSSRVRKRALSVIATRPRLQSNLAISALLLLTAGLGFGLVIAHGGRWAYVALGIFAASLMGLVTSATTQKVLLTWAALSGVAYPFIRYPLHAAPEADFDRLVTVVLLVGFLVAPRFSHASVQSRRLSGLIAVFVVLFGARAVAMGSHTPIELWVDEILAPATLFWAASRVMTSQALTQRLCGCLTFLGASVACLGLAEWRLHFQLATWSGFEPFVDSFAHVVRVSGPYGDPTSYGTVLVMCIAATYYWWQTSTSSLGGLALLVELLGTYPTFTKTTWIGALLVVLVMVGVRPRAVGRALGFALALAVAVFLALTLLRSNPVIEERVFHSGRNFTARLGDFLQGWHIFVAHPLWGVGIGHFIAAQQHTATVYVFGQTAAQSPHNNLIVLAAENGLSGVLPYLLVLLVAGLLVHRYRCVAKSREEALFGLVLLAAALSYFLMSLTLVLLAYPPGTMVLALILGAGAGRLNAVAQLHKDADLIVSHPRMATTAFRRPAVPAP